MGKIDIGQDIRNVRIELQLTQRAFAELFNKTKPLKIQTHYRDISKYEKGTNSCPAEKYAKFMALKTS